jgi:predicted MPP superfamily phosphohydrolase
MLTGVVACVRFSPGKSGMKKKHIVLMGIALLAAYSGVIEPNWIVQRTHSLKIQGLGPDTLKIVHIADLHTTRYGFRESRTKEMIRQIDPDYIFFTGDLLKSYGDLAPALDFLTGLRAREGTYLVPGNADVLITRLIRRGQLSKESLGYRILINESVDCGPFTLVGLGDPVSGEEDVDKAFNGVDEFKPVFVMVHFHPDSLLEDLEKYKVDMVFSGHTHGGQCGLPLVVKLVPYASRSEYLAGLYQHNGFLLDVTKGLGTNIFPLRLLCRPEIVVFELYGE